MWQKFKNIMSILSTLIVLIGVFLMIFNRCSDNNDLKDKSIQRKTTIAVFSGRDLGGKRENVFSMRVNDKPYNEHRFSSIDFVIGEAFQCEYFETSSVFSEYNFIIYANKPIIRDSSLFKYTNLTELETGSWFNAHTNTFSYLVEGKKYTRTMHCDTLSSNIDLYKVFYNSTNPQIGYLVNK
jgi:hypothetical protein